MDKDRIEAAKDALNRMKMYGPLSVIEYLESEVERLKGKELNND